MSTFPARIGHLTQGQIRSIALHQANHQTGELLARYLTHPTDVDAVIARGDLRRIDQHRDLEHRVWGKPYIILAHDPQGAKPILHPDNQWPPGAACLYLHQQDTWWSRRANPDGTYPGTWTPINQQESP